MSSRILPDLPIQSTPDSSKKQKTDPLPSSANNSAIQAINNSSPTSSSQQSPQMHPLHSLIYTTSDLTYDPTSSLDPNFLLQPQDPPPTPTSQPFFDNPPLSPTLSTTESVSNLAMNFLLSTPTLKPTASLQPMGPPPISLSESSIATNQIPAPSNNPAAVSSQPQPQVESKQPAASNTKPPSFFSEALYEDAGIEFNRISNLPEFVDGGQAQIRCILFYLVYLGGTDKIKDEAIMREVYLHFKKYRKFRNLDSFKTSIASITRGPNRIVDYEAILISIGNLIPVDGRLKAETAWINLKAIWPRASASKNIE